MPKYVVTLDLEGWAESERDAAHYDRAATLRREVLGEDSERVQVDHLAKALAQAEDRGAAQGRYNPRRGDAFLLIDASGQVSVNSGEGVPEARVRKLMALAAEFSSWRADGEPPIPVRKVSPQ